MSSTVKTLELLSYFSPARPEIGLSQLCRLAHRDKATTHRHLQALEETGFVERNAASRRYRLGPVVLQLAQIREHTVPRKTSARAALIQLCDATGETAHLSVLSRKTLYVFDSCKSPDHGGREIMDVQSFPLHATASGLCALAFGSPSLMKIALDALTPFTAQTVTTAEALLQNVQTVRDTGFSYADRTFKDDIYGIAVPVFDKMGAFAGAVTVSVACAARRDDPEITECTQQNLVIASREITRNWGGVVPDALEEAWAKSLPPSQILESSA